VCSCTPDKSFVMPREGLAEGVSMPVVSKIVPCLWFDSQAKEAAEFYVSVFKGGADRERQPLHRCGTRGAWAVGGVGDDR
jgi:hypothetical protein